MFLPPLATVTLPKDVYSYRLSRLVLDKHKHFLFGDTGKHLWASQVAQW